MRSRGHPFGPMDPIRFGRSLQALRRRGGWRQQDVADRTAMSRSVVSRIERGELRGISIVTVDTVTQALGARLDLRVLWRGEGLERLLDRRHAALVDLVVRRLRRYGWQVVVEASFSNLWRARLNRRSGVAQGGRCPARRRGEVGHPRPAGHIDGARPESTTCSRRRPPAGLATIAGLSRPCDRENDDHTPQARGASGDLRDCPSEARTRSLSRASAPFRNAGWGPVGTKFPRGAHRAPKMSSETNAKDSSVLTLRLEIGGDGRGECLALVSRELALWRPP